MALERFANYALTTASGSSGTTSPVSGTQETWTVSSSSSFPAVTTAAGTYFHIADPALPTELIQVTNITGTTWTVIRGAESTTPVAHTTGFTIKQVVSAGWLTNSLEAIPPSGDATGATDTAVLNAALAATSAVYLQSGTFFVNAPIVIPSNTQLKGATPVTYSGDNIQGAWTGTTISPVSGFNKGAYTNPAAVFLGDGNGTATFEGPGLQDLLVDGSNGPTGLAGIVAYGPVQAITVRRVGVWHAKADGIGIYSSGSGKPDGGAFDTIIIQSCNSGNGMVLDGADMDVSAVHSQGNHLDGFVITHANNTLRGCRADHNANGYTTGTSAQASIFNTIKLIGCSTQGNNLNGLNVTTGESTGVSATAPVVCSGCTFQGDGANNGSSSTTLAGILASGTVTVILNGCTVTTDTTDYSGGSPYYAIATAAAGSSNGKPQLVQVMGGMYGSLHSGAGTPQVNDAAPATLMSYSFHGYTGTSLTTGTTISLQQGNPL